MKPKPPSPTYQQTVYYGRHQQRHQQLQNQQQLIPERTLWSYIIQLLSAIKKVHENGQAVRMIDVSKVLVTGQNRFVLFVKLTFLPLTLRSDRVRISSCCIFDVLLFGTPQQDITVFQQDDLVKLGRLIFALCTNNVSGSNQSNMQKSLEMMKKVYSVDVQALALFLCSKIPKVCGDTEDGAFS